MKTIPLRKLPLLLAAALQILPVCRTVCTHPSATSTFAVIFRWAVGATAVASSFDAVSGATTVYIDSPTTTIGTVGSNLTFYITLGGTVGDNGGTVIVGSPLPPGFSITAMTTNVGNTFTEWGVLSGTPTTTLSNFLINIVVTNPKYVNGQSVPIQVTGSLRVSAVESSTPVVVSTQPTNVVATQGQPVSFGVAATGTGPFTYQWFKGDTNIINHIPGATNAAYSFTASTNSAASSFAVNSGVYVVRISGAAGMTVSAPATLTVNSPLLAITVPPTNLTVNAGQPASFNVAATGNPTLTYQWFKFGTNRIAGATNDSYTIASVVPNDAGDYTVLVTNSVRKLTSSIATLTVISNAVVAPAITTQPVDQLSVVAGQPVTLSAVASGTEPLSYQWTKDSSEVAGATNASFNLTNVRSSDAGTYALVVTNTAGSITSSNAVLTVSLPGAPAVTVAEVVGNEFRFTFTPVVGLTNAVLTNAVGDAIAGWGILTNVPPPPSTAPITVTDPIDGDARFYRVRIEP